MRVPMWIAPISGYKQPVQMELYLKFFNEAYRPGEGQRIVRITETASRNNLALRTGF